MAKKLGLALGSGSARGIAHIGVLKVLEGAGIRPDVIAGTSIGAVIGSFFAAGHSAAEIEGIACSFDIKALIALADVALSRSAIIAGEKVEAFLAEHLPRDFADLAIPFGCVSADLRTGEQVVHTEGDLVAAVRASLSIPIVFMPVESGSKLLVDGGLVQPVPVDVARRLGADRVIAVPVFGTDVTWLIPAAAAGGPAKLGKAERGASSHPKFFTSTSGEAGVPDDAPPDADKVLNRIQIGLASFDVMQREIALAALQRADIVIAPDVAGFSQLAFLEASTLVRLGEEAARKAVDDVREMLEPAPRTLGRRFGKWLRGD